MQFNLKKANKYIPYVLLIGVGIGTANFIMNGELNWIQWVIQSISTSFLIGYTLVIIASNKSWFKLTFNATWKLYVVLFFTFFLLGVLATEVEQIIRIVIFSSEKFQLFSAGKMYLFNGIISLVLGFSFFQNKHFFPSDQVEKEKIDLPNPEIDLVPNLEPSTPLLKLPVKHDNTIYLIPIEEIVYLEAFDNYAFVFDVKGVKRLCDYSLIFLQDRLGDQFIRIHRKYIVNTNHIKQIKSQSNGRYLILFEETKLAPIISSKSYAPIIRKLIRIK